MLPASHFAVMIIPYSLYSLVVRRRLPGGPPVLVLLFATQLPDIIDKPLAWTFGIIPSGRMFAHSLVVAVPLLVILTVVAIHRGRERLALLFNAGYLSHLVGDFYPILSQGTGYYFFPNLFWPLLAANPDRNASFAAHAPENVWAVLIPLAVFTAALGYGLIDSYRKRPQVT